MSTVYIVLENMGGELGRWPCKDEGEAYAVMQRILNDDLDELNVGDVFRVVEKED